MRLQGKTIILLVFFVSISQTQYTTYIHNFDTQTNYAPRYELGLLSPQTSINILMNTTSGPNSLPMNLATITVNSVSLNPPVIVPCVGLCTTSQCNFTCDIQVSTFYELNIVANGFPVQFQGVNPSQIQPFQITVISYLTSSTVHDPSSRIILEVTQILRDKVSRLIYLETPRYVHFSLYPAVQSAPNQPDYQQASIHLFPVQNIFPSENIYSAHGTNDILSDFTKTARMYSSQDRILNYNSTVLLPRGFYMLAVTYLPNIHFARITFSTAQYTCPYNPLYPDISLNFQGCTPPFNIQTPGFPCLQFDNILQKCLTCAGTYSLVNGSCVFSTLCPDRFYYHFGSCLEVDSKCSTYDKFTGWCLTCIHSNMTLHNGKCIPLEVNCGLRQYKSNGICIDVSPLCNHYDPINGSCITCIQNYTPQNGTCVQKEPNCTEFQYVFNLTCRDIPLNCSRFNKQIGLCQQCDPGFYLKFNSCSPNFCPKMTYLDIDTLKCKDVSPLCNTYDEITGDCLSCKYSGYTVRQGKCLQFTSPLAGCQQRQKMGFGPCGDAVVNCQSYNLVTNNCEKCVDGWFVDYTGKCLLNQVKCQADEVVIQGICVQKPNNCQQVDQIGLCIHCFPGFTLQQGQCFFRQKCEPNKISIDGKCVFITPNCRLYNPTTGQCLTCNDGRPAVQGLCCKQNQYVFNGHCTGVDFNSQVFFNQTMDNPPFPHCIIFHPTLNYCLQCNEPYNVDPTDMTKCR